MNLLFQDQFQLRLLRHYFSISSKHRLLKNQWILWQFANLLIEKKKSKQLLLSDEGRIVMRLPYLYFFAVKVCIEWMKHSEFLFYRLMMILFVQWIMMKMLLYIVQLLRQELFLLYVGMCTLATWWNKWYSTSIRSSCVLSLWLSSTQLWNNWIDSIVHENISFWFLGFPKGKTCGWYSMENGICENPKCVLFD